MCPQFIVQVPPGLRDVGVLLEPTSVIEKGIAQAYEIQRRLRVWRPRTALVLGAGTIGLLATMALRLRGLDVHTFAREARTTRNTWSWQTQTERPLLERLAGSGDTGVVRTRVPGLGSAWLYADGPEDVLFTENETNDERLFGTPNRTPFVKDAFHAIVDGPSDAVNPAQTGTKAAVRWRREIPAGESAIFRVRLSEGALTENPFGDFDATFERRQREADEFYRDVNPFALSDDGRRIQRQAFAGLLWSKQWYHFVVRDWLSAVGRRYRRPTGADSAATRNGRICAAMRFFRCPTNGSTPGSRRGILRFMSCRSRSSTPALPSVSC